LRCMAASRTISTGTGCGQAVETAMPPQNPTTETFRILFDVVLKRWKPALGIGVLAGLLAMPPGLLLPRKYQASSMLLIAESKTASSSVSNLFFNPQLYGTYQGIIRNPDVAGKAIEQFHLGKQLNIEKFLRKLNVRIVRDSRLVEVSFNDTDPRRAADVVNYVSDIATSRCAEINQQDTGSVKRLLESEMGRIEGRYGEAKSTLEKFRAEARISAVEEEVKRLLADKSALESKALQLQIQLARRFNEQIPARLEQGIQDLDAFEKKHGIKKLTNELEALLALQKKYVENRGLLLITLANLRGQLGVFEAELARQERIELFSFKVDKTAAPPDETKQGASEIATLLGALQGLDLKEERLNPSYVTLLEKRAETNSDLQGALLQKEELDKKVTEGEKTIKEIEKRTIEYQTKRDKLAQDVAIMRAEYGTVFSSSEQELNAYLAIVDGKLREIEAALNARQKELAEKQVQLDSLTLQYSIASTNFQKYREQYEQLLLSVTEKFQGISVISKAYAPEKPASLSTPKMAALTFLLFFCGSLCLYGIREILVGMPRDA